MWRTHTWKAMNGTKAPVLALQDWCRAHSAEVLAVQPPGRNMRGREPCATSARELGAAVLAAVGSKLYDVPYVVRAALGRDVRPFLGANLSGFHGLADGATLF